MQVAIVLAAGEGKKMFPYDLTRQKCAIPIANEPIVRRLVTQLRDAGISQTIVVTGYHSGQVHEAIGDLQGITFVHQSQRDGTATAVLLALQTLPNLSDLKEFLVAYGDVVLTQDDLTALLQAHEDSDSIATVLVQRLTAPMDSRDWLCADVKSNQILSVYGHPRDASHRLVGLFAFRKEVIPFLERNPGVMKSVEVGGMPPMEYELAQSLQMMVEANKKLYAVETKGFIIDIDKPWHILEASEKVVNELQQQFPENRIPKTARVDESAEINGHIVLGDSCIIGKRVVINGFLLANNCTQITNGAILNGRIVTGKNCKLRDYCLLTESVLGSKCIVGHGAEFEGVAFNTVYLYHYCEIAGVIGESVDLGAATVCGNLRFDDANKIHKVLDRREIPHIGANVNYIGDFARTGVNAILMPGVKVGAYSIVGPAVILYEDLPHRQVVLVKQQLERRPWGPERYGW